MGHQIAVSAALSGFQVKCTDVSPEILSKAKQFADSYLPERVALGGVIPIISAILANFIKAWDEGLAFGLDNSVTAAGRGTAPLLGAVIATSWGYPLTFMVTGMVFVVSTALAVWRLPPSRPAPSDISVSS